MSGTRSARVATRRRLVELLSAEPVGLDGTVVRYGTPPDAVNERSIWLGDITGETTVANMRAGRKARDDRYTIEVHCFAFALGDETGEAADLAVEELADAVVDAVHADVTLGGVIEGLSWCAQLGGPANGPDAFRTDDGHGSYRTLSLTCQARLN